MQLSEDALYCGHICMAARGLGFRLSYIQSGDEHQYVWVDLMNNMSQWACNPAKTKEESLVNACKSLTNYISCQPATT